MERSTDLMIFTDAQMYPQPEGGYFHCKPFSPDVSPSGDVACVLIEARVGDPCTCDAADGRAPVAPEHAGALAEAQANVAPELGCFCEVPAAQGDARAVCEQSPDPTMPSGEAVNGWCFIDATQTPPLGDPIFVEPCPNGEQQVVRMVGNATPTQWDATLVIICDRQACEGGAEER